MEYKKQYLYSKFERFWHWTQMLLVLLLTLTGFEIHGNYHIFGFENSVRLHNASAWSFMGLALVSSFKAKPQLYPYPKKAERTNSILHLRHL